MTAPSLPNQHDKLRCLLTGSRLEQASAELLARIQHAAKTRSLRDNLGRVVEHKVEEALINTELTMCYPIVEGAIQMMRDEAIPLRQPSIDGQTR